MGEERKFGSITYQDVGADYFEKRRLRRHAGMWSLWALGVGAVISGEYYGWNFGLGTGGFSLMPLAIDLRPRSVIVRPSLLPDSRAKSSSSCGRRSTRAAG